MKRYALWDKKTPIITPVGEVFTAEQWMDRYPVARLPEVDILCSPGQINGGFFGTLGQLLENYESQIDFAQYATAQEKLDALEAWLDEQEKLASERVEETPITPEERIAAALEYQVLMSMPDVE